MTPPDQAKERETVNDEGMTVWLCEKGHADDHHLSAHPAGERCSRCGGVTTKTTVARLASALEERDRLLDSLAELTAYIDTDQLPPEVQDRLDACLTRSVDVLDAKDAERDRVLGELVAAGQRLHAVSFDWSHLNSVATARKAWRAALARTTQGGEADDGGASSTASTVETRPPLSASEPCPGCDGKGHYVGWPHLTCPTCHGEGVLDAKGRAPR